MFELQENALTTPERVLKFLGEGEEEMSVNGNDMLILAINAASDMIEKYCRRQFKRDIYTYNSFIKENSFVLPNYPVHKLISVNGQEEKGDYYLSKEDGIIDFRNTNRRGLIIYDGGYTLPKDATVDNPITLPQGLEIACMRLIDSLYVGEDGFVPSFNTLKLGDFSTGGGSTSSTDVQSLLPSEITNTLDLWKDALLWD